VLQDFDLNWCFPGDVHFSERAQTLFRRMIARLSSHPSIYAWVCANEIWPEPAAAGELARKLAVIAVEVDPTRAAIVNCGWAHDDPASGDAHRYAGALDGGRYTDMADRTYKMLSEFGVDAPAGERSLRQVAVIAQRLKPLLPQLGQLHDYQYRLIKYHCEQLRISKYDPCGGYFHFMWIDLCPQSFYGVIDFWGEPKSAGLGGGVRALREANMPLAIIMQHGDLPQALWVVNDRLTALGRCLCEWLVRDQAGTEIVRGEMSLEVPADSRLRICDLQWEFNKDHRYRVDLLLRDAQGVVLAANRYDDACVIQERLDGYPTRMDHELGMRLWSA
jgi:hypothetical protein